MVPSEDSTSEPVPVSATDDANITEQEDVADSTTPESAERSHKPLLGLNFVAGCIFSDSSFVSNSFVTSLGPFT